MEDLQIQAINASSDVEDFFETYVLDELTREDDLEEYVSKIEQVKRDFRRVYSQLKAKEGEGFRAKYPEFGKTLETLTDSLRVAKKKWREAKTQDNDDPKLNPMESVVTAQSEKEKLRSTSDRKSFLEQANWELDNCVWEDLNDFDEIKSMISFFQSRLDEFRKICTELAVCFGNDNVETRFREKNENFITQLREKIDSGKNRFSDLKFKIEEMEKDILAQKETERIEAESSRIALAKQEEEARIKELVACAKNLQYEIKSRYESLKRKCLSAESLKSLNPYEILNLKKCEENLHLEHRELIDKVSSFETYVLPCGELATDMRDNVSEMRDYCSTAVWDFIEALNKTIKERDISEQKLKNSAGLNIEMKKFKGYISDTDVYTFRSEFRKMVEPEVCKNLWPEYLKKNCLAGAAYNLVSKIENMDDIWTKLIEVYGDTNLMLQNKLGSLGKFSGLEKIKDDEKIVNGITGLLNAMEDVSKLARDYSLENELYYGTGLHRILDLLGKTRERKFIKSISSQKINCKEKWTKLVGFLQDEVKEREAYVLNEKVKKCNEDSTVLDEKSRSRDEKAKSNSDKSNVFLGQSAGSDEGRPACFICGKTNDHVISTDSNGKQYIDYVACKVFVDKSPHERNKLLLRKRFCVKCLKPGIIWNSDHECDNKFVCKQAFVKDGVEKQCKKHVLVCGHHCDTSNNKIVLEEYKQKVITLGNFLDFTKKISISCFSESYAAEALPDVRENSIFAFQPINVCGVKINIFYDNGCGDMVLSKEAADNLVQIGRAKQICPGPLTLNGVNDQTSICPHGAYEITLPLLNGEDATLSGICVDYVTEQFPFYPLKEVEKDFRVQIGKTRKDLLPTLPKLPRKVGGKVSVMIGKAYLKYFPKEVARLDTGLTLYDSMFKSFDRSTGVISGPHPEFSKINRTANFSQVNGQTYYSTTAQNYYDMLKRIGDVPLLGYQKRSDESYLSFSNNGCITDDVSSTTSDPLISFLENENNVCEFGDPVAGGRGSSIENKVYTSKRGPKCLKTYERIEKTGTEVSYRCMECRNCKECLRAGLVEEISFVDEAQQDVINKSVTVDTKNKVSSASLPFIANPDTMLADNKKSTLKIYQSQVKRLNKSDKDRNDVLEAEKKLQDLGFVDWLHNLDKDDQDMILNALMHFLAWQIVWSKSITTSIRPVFNGSLKTLTGYSINDIVAKGSNNMNNLVEMLIRWQIKIFGYHTDIRKMYNSVQLNKEHWRFQLYWWSENLKPDETPLIKVIKTCIYGIKSSGNQAERALRMVVEQMSDKYPMAAEVVNNDIYVDDVISGEMTEKERSKATDELKLSLEKGGFTLKGLTLSGEDPDVTLSENGVSVKTGGVIYYPKGDFIMLNTGDLNFAKKVCGRKSENKSIPDNLTLRQCASIVAQVFDPYGKAVPVTAGFKSDLSHLQRDLNLSWDDQIPENLRGLWINNFEMLQELGQLKYKRVVVPPDAKNLDIVTIEAGDATPKLICAAVYARFQCKDGSFSCQLVFARSKVVPEGMSVPRAELMAASTLAATGFTVQRAFGKYHTASIKISDSMVALHWIAASRKMLKVWVRGHVIEINRLCELSTWRYVESSKNPSDLGTRKGAKVADVAQGSTWIDGLPWMRLPEEQFPTISIKDIKLSNPDMIEANKEKIVLKTFYCRKTLEMDSVWVKQIGLRYKYSKYLIDPNRYRFRKVVRILALVLEFIRKISKNLKGVQNSSIFNHKIPGNIPDVLRSNWDKYIVTTGSSGCDPGKVIFISQNMLQNAFHYFALKASAEVKKFLNKSKYKDISKEIDGVLYYSGRILPDQEFGGYPDLCGAALDLCKTTFCVPVMDRCSPVAISIALEIHWFHPDFSVRHHGIETVHRQTLKIAHIISGMRLATAIKLGCKRCRILNKKSIEVAMGPIQDVNLCIAPAFYASQVDIFGPFKAYSIANKRATIKVWFLIFCCCTTGGIDIKIMEDYSTESFVLGFIRFSCRFGYPRYLLPDPGSQLVKGCEGMSYTFVDAKQRLFGEFGVDYMPSPVGAHYTHGKVERKIREVKKCVQISTENERLSIVQWETLMFQIANSINNLPIGLRNKVSNLENLDLITPNRLILGRNNDRSGNAPLIIRSDHKKMIEKNADIFRAWFHAWITSYVPTLIERPKWHKTDQHIEVGDIVLFLKSEKEFDLQYQYGMVSKVYLGKDNRIRKVDVDYQNNNEQIKRSTQRGVRDLVIVHSVEDLDIYEILHDVFDTCE